MKNIITILLITASLNASSQFATKQYVDSLFSTLQTIVIKPPKLTTSNNTILLDTLTMLNNTKGTYIVSVETETDIALKTIIISNKNGVYSLIQDSNLKPLSTKGFFSSVPSWSVSNTNNLIIIKATGVKNTIISWTIKKTIL